MFVLGTKAFCILIQLGFLGAFASAGGFGDHQKDVTNDPHYYGEFKPGTTFITVTDLFYRQLKPTDHKGVLENPDAKRPLHQYPPDDRPHPTVEEFKAHPDRCPELRLIPIGQKIRMTKLIYRNHIEFDEVEIFGEFQGGDNAGQQVYLNLASVPADPNNPAGLPRKSDPKLLKIDTTPTTQPAKP